MYAVIVTGGRQYRVAQGETLRVESSPATSAPRSSSTRCCMVGEGEGVTSALRWSRRAGHGEGRQSHGRADKIRIVKFRRRKHHRKEMGHRQHYTEIEIIGITGASDKKRAAKAEKTAEE